MIVGLPRETQLGALVWMVAGLLIYFGYSKKHSKLGNVADILPKASDFEKQ
jgi:APA family basic amino acid/polyamine antiporter